MTHRPTSAAPLLAALLLSGCWGGEDDSGGLIDTYAPKYTEPGGTVHAGDFFPLTPGDIFSIGGSMETDFRMSLRGRSGGQPVSLDSSSTTIDTVEGTVETLEPRELATSRGTFTVRPQAVLLSHSTEGSGASEVMTSYYEKAADAIHLRGHQGAEFEPVAEPDPSLYLKLPLRVGDSWESASTEGDEAAEGTELQVDARSRTFVVGMESITVAGRNVQALRLDQVQEVTGSGVQDGVPMTLAGEFTYVIHLVEGEGQVRESITGRVTVKGSASQGENSADVTVIQDVRGEMTRVPIQLLTHAKPGAGAPAAVAPLRGHRVASSPASRSLDLPTSEARVAAAARELALGVARSRRLASAFPRR